VFILKPIEVLAENIMLKLKSSKTKQIGVLAAVSKPADSSQRKKHSIWVISNCVDNGVRDAV
jgi:hypothetical protein